MRHELLKNKEDIKQWLKNHDITNYNLIEDKEYGYLVDVNTSVILCNCGLNEIKVKFGHIEGDFYVSKNYLKSLLGSPRSVLGTFSCSENQLKSLQYGPLHTRSYFCKSNELTTLEYAPLSVELLDCSYNMITSLKHLPAIPLITIIASHNEIKTLGDIQFKCLGFIKIENNLLEDLEGFSEHTKYMLGGNPKLGKYQGMRKIVNLEQIQQEFNTEKEKKQLNVTIVKSVKESKINKL